MTLSQTALAASPQMHHEAVAAALVAICAEPSSEPALAREIDALEDELRAAPESVRASACAAWPASADELAARLAILLAEWGWVSRTARPPSNFYAPWASLGRMQTRHGGQHGTSLPVESRTRTVSPRVPWCTSTPHDARCSKPAVNER